MSTTRPTTTPVLIVGGGPNGCMLALWLSRFGVPSVVVERSTSELTAPRAHAVNPRTLEICRALGLDVATIRDAAMSRDEAGHVRFAPRLDGPIFGSLPYERQDDAAFEHTPTPLVNIPQPEFEAFLFRAIDDDANVTFVRGVEWLSYVTDDDLTISTVTDGDLTISTVTDGDDTWTIESRYLIGADGAASAVRTALGVSLSGEPEVHAAVSIVFEADLRGIVADRPGVLYWLTDPAVQSTLLAYRPDRLWTLVRTMPAGRIDISTWDEERCIADVRAALGDSGATIDPRIEYVTPWTVRSEVADTYRTGPVLLIGDAAHRFPSTGGLGLNTGVQDAHNLAWKLAAVLAGDAPDALLDTYDAERRPIALRNAEQSLVNNRRLAALAELEVPREIWHDAGAYASWFAEGDRADRVAAAIELQREHFDSFGLQLGFRYGAEPTASEPGRFVPSAEVGDRLPHAWVGDPADGLSTLDLLNPTAFTLIGTGELPAVPGVTVVNADALETPSAWFEITGLATGGAVLVRPDGHVTARFDAAPTADAVSAARAFALGQNLTAAV